MRVGIAADHEGFELKEQIAKSLDKRGYEIKDFGAYSVHNTDDFPDFVIPLARAVSIGKMQRGIAICGSGIGACIMANKVLNIRAGQVHDSFSARQGVEDDDMNMICLGARLVSMAESVEWVQDFLNASFSKLPRHVRRIQKIKLFENNQNNYMHKALTRVS